MKTITKRIQRLEKKAPKAPPRVVSVATEEGRPASAFCNGETLKPKPGEALADFEDRAEDYFKTNQVRTICPGGEGPFFRSRGTEEKKYPRQRDATRKN